MNALCPPTASTYAMALRQANNPLGTPESREAARDLMEEIRDAMVAEAGTRRLTATELRDRNVLAMRPARFADLRDPEPVGFPIFAFLIFAQLLILATAACALAVWLFMWGAEHIGNRNAATLEQARNPAFVEWSE